MPNFKALSTLTKEGKVYPINSIIELTKEQGERLVKQNKAEATEEGEVVKDAVYSEEQFRALTADQQKELVAEHEGDLAELTNADKRWEFFATKQ